MRSLTRLLKLILKILEYHVEETYEIIASLLSIQDELEKGE